MNLSRPLNIDWWRDSPTPTTAGPKPTQNTGSTDGSSSTDSSDSTDASGSNDYSGSSSQASPSPSPDEDEIVFPKPTSEDCRYISYDATTHCGTYRPCDSCLRKYGCRIGLSGLCELDSSDGTNLSAIYDYRLAFDLNLTLPGALKLNNESALHTSQMWVFPASEVTYCPADDSICQLCIKKNFWLSDGTDSRFCVGDTATGTPGQLCVCVSNCASSVNATYCPPLPVVPIVNPTKNDDDWWRVCLVVVIAVVVGAFILCGILWCCCCIRRRRDQRKAEAEAVEAELALAGPTSTIPADGYFEEESGRSVEL